MTKHRLRSSEGVQSCFEAIIPIYVCKRTFVKGLVLCISIAPHQGLGLLVHGQNILCVEQSPFNDRHYNRDLPVLCKQANEASPRLLDGRRLLFAARDIPCPILDIQKRRVN